MAQWIRTDRRLKAHDRMLTIGYRTPETEAICKCLMQVENDPDQLEALLKKLILNVRPELVGCVIWAIGFRPDRRQWEIIVSHGSFPPADWGEEMFCEELFPN